MAETKAKKKPAAPALSPEYLEARRLRDQLRRLAAMRRSIKTEARAAERAYDAAREAISEVVNGYLESLGAVMVSSEAYDRLRKEHGEMTDRLRIIDSPTAESVRELAGAGKA